MTTITIGQAESGFFHPQGIAGACIITKHSLWNSPWWGCTLAPMCCLIISSSLIWVYCKGKPGLRVAKLRTLPFLLQFRIIEAMSNTLSLKWILKKFKCSRSSEKRIHCEVWWLKRASEESRFRLCLGKQARLWSEQLGEANHIVSKGEEAGKQKMP